MGLEKGGLNVLCKLQLEGNEKLIDQKSKMLLIAPIPTDSIPMTKALVGYSDVSIMASCGGGSKIYCYFGNFIQLFTCRCSADTFPTWCLVFLSQSTYPLQHVSSFNNAAWDQCR